MVLDIKLLYFLNGLAGQSRIFDGITVFLASYSQYFFVAGFLLLLYFSAYPGKHKLHVFLVATISAVTARFGVTEIIRSFYNRPRPFITHHLRQLIQENDWSFPSGHSAFFFAAAVAIYLYNKKWGAWFFVVALLMNISRVIAGVHYPSDIIGGAVIGAVAAYIIFRIYIGKFGGGEPRLASTRSMAGAPTTSPGK